MFESFIIYWKNIINLIVLCIILYFLSKAVHVLHSLLTPWSRVLEQQIISWPVKILPAYFGT
jgi:hypothetical protein